MSIAYWFIIIIMSVISTAWVGIVSWATIMEYIERKRAGRKGLGQVRIPADRLLPRQP